MKYLLSTFFFQSIFFRLALSLSPTYQQCQLEKSSGESPVAGCPAGTIYVSSSDASHAKFSSIQNAIDSLPETGDAIILIGKGQYYEKVEVKRAAPLILLGQLDTTTKNHNLVYIWDRQSVSAGVTDSQTAALNVVGSTDLKVYNINFENRAASYAIAQALVTSVENSNASFYGCTFASWQDTWYTGWNANTYVVDSTIFGQTDYLFGCGIAWFQSVTLANRGCGGGITAWQGSSGTKNGVYIADSNIIRSPDTAGTTVTTKACYLGRPWNSYAVVVFLRNYMEDIIQPTGFTAWYGESKLSDTIYFAESGSHGPGSNTSARISQEHILTATEAERFTLEEVFDGTPSWIDLDYQR